MTPLSQWDSVALGEICDKIGSGATPRGGEQVYLDEGISLIRSQNVYNGTFTTDGLAHISGEHADKLRNVTVETEDVLLNITGDSVARCCQVPDDVLPARVNQHVAIIRANQSELLNSFIKYFMISPRMQAQMLSFAGSGGTRRALTKEMIEGFIVPHPSTSVQERIVEILSAYDDLIENNLRRIKLLEESARLLYREWFVHFRFPGHEHVKIVDGVPEGWRAGVVSDFHDTASGGTPSRRQPDFYTGDILWVKTQELRNGFIVDTDERITEEAIQRSSAKLFPANTVLVAMYGATIGQLGILAYPAASNQACCALLPKRETAGSAYCYFFFRENKDALISLSMGAAQRNVSQQIIRAFPMVMPTDVLAGAFAETAGPALDEIRCLTEQNAALRRARDILLPRLMNGTISV